MLSIACMTDQYALHCSNATSSRRDFSTYMFSLLFFFLPKFTCTRSLKSMWQRSKIIISKFMQFAAVYFKFIMYIAIKFCFFSPQKKLYTYWLSRSDEEAVLPLSIPDLYSKETYLFPFAACEPWCCTDQYAISPVPLSSWHASKHKLSLV